MTVRQASYAAPAAACAAEVLRSLRQSDSPLSLAELERSLPRSKSLIFRVLRELEAQDLVARDAVGRYRLGIEAFELGAGYLSQLDQVEIVRGTLAQLARETGDTVNLGVLRGADVLYLMKFPGASAYVTISRVGGRVPAHCVAIGKALLANLPEVEVRRRLRDPLPRMTNLSIERVDDLLVELEQVRTRGYAEDLEQAALGRCAIAFRVAIGADGQPAAISISTAASDFDTRHETLVSRLRHARDTLDRDHRTRARLARLGADNEGGFDRSMAPLGRDDGSGT